MSCCGRAASTPRCFVRASGDLCLPKPVFLCVGRVAVEKNLEAFLALDLPGTKVIVGDGPARERARARHIRKAVFLGAAAGRGAGAGLCRRRRLRVSEPHRYVRPGAAGGAGERPAGRGLSGGRSARRHRHGAGRSPERGSARGLPRGAADLARGVPRLRRQIIPGRPARRPSSIIWRMSACRAPDPRSWRRAAEFVA